MSTHNDKRDTDDAEIDDRMAASRERFIAGHDAAFDFEAGWADIVARAEATTPRSAPPVRLLERRPDDAPVPAVVDPRRRPARRRMLVGVGSIAAAVGLVAAIVVTGPDGNGERDLAPQIITATRSALADSVEHVTTDWTRNSIPLDNEAWRDQVTAAVRFLHYAEDGSGRSLDTGPLDAPTVDTPGPSTGPHPHLSVDHCFDEYEIEDVPIPEGATDISASLAEGVADELEAGSMHTDGTEVVDGKEYIRVVSDSAPDAVWYVDPVTHRPELLIDEEEGYTSTIEYLPRTPELLAQFTPVIPEGMPQVPELTRTDDWRACS